jgi:Protein CHAPERONE-LIKE PROTEIN OF POR1-like
MSDTSHYEILGVNEESSFDEIQAARRRLVKEKEGDERAQQAVEAAYDAILMERLKLRQEGRIKVPEGIRFPEKLDPPAKSVSPPAISQSPSWLKNLLDQPGQTDILLPAALFSGLSLLAVLTTPALPLALGVGFCLYFLNRKEHKFGRSLLLTLAGLIVGVVLGLQVGGLFATQLQSVLTGATLETFAALVTFVILWLISSFLK